MDHPMRKRGANGGQRKPGAYHAEGRPEQCLTRAGDTLGQCLAGALPAWPGGRSVGALSFSGGGERLINAADPVF